MNLILRRLSRRPLYAVIGIVTAALSLSAAGIVAAVVNGLWWSSPAAYDARSLVRVWEAAAGDEVRLPVSRVGTRAIARSTPSLGDLAMYVRTELTVRAEQSVRLQAAVVSHNFFEVYRVRLVEGRDFTAEDAGLPVLLISEQVWVRQFGRADAAVGSTLSILGIPFTVIGIVPDELAIPHPSVDLWLPLQAHAVSAEEASLHEFQVVGRLRAGASLEQLREDLASSALLPVEGDERHVVKAQSLEHWLYGNARERARWLMLAAVCVILVAIANWASLVTARILEIGRELAIREALGARKRTTFLQIVAEQTVLAGLAFPLALWIAAAASDGLTRILADPQQAAPEFPLLALPPLLTMVLAAGGSVVLIALVSGRWRSGSLDAQLKAARSVGRHRGLAGSNAVVTLEVTAAVVLSALTVHLVGRYAQLTAVDTGLRETGLTLMSMTLAGTDYASSREVATFYRRLQQELTRHPAVSVASAIDAIPLGEDPGTDELLVEGIDPGLRTWEGVTVHYVLSGYFRASGTPLPTGRDFTASERRDRPVAIVSASLARAVWGERSPLGAKIKIARWREEEWRTVVGVAADVRNLGLGQAPGFVVYEPHTQFPQRAMTVMARTTPGHELTPADLTGMVRSLDPSVPVERPTSFLGKMQESIGTQRQQAQAATIVSVLVLVLASGGIFGIVSFVLASRQREMAVRAALGAGPQALIVHALGSALRPALVGVVLGIATTLVLVVEFGVQEWRPRALETAAASAFLVLLVALLAALRPALRSGRIPPADALKELSP